jgi:hypothetical protein
LWGIRRQVSLLLSEGHADAPHYPIGMVWDESRLAVERINRFHATQAVLTQQAVASILSRDGQKEFKKTITGLNENG